MRISPRIFAVGFGQNLATFVAWGVIPLWAAFDMRASPAEMGALPAVSGIAYIAVALKAGALSDRVGRGRLARFGMAGFAAFCLLAWSVRTVPAVTLLGAVNGASLALVWPSLQASVGDASGPGDLERNLGAFSLSWSLSKTLGFLAIGGLWEGGGLYSALGIDTLLACAAVSLLMIPVLPARREAPHHAPPKVAEGSHPPAVRSAHLRSGWCSNFAAYGMGATLVYLQPALLHATGRDPRDHGWILFAVYLSQTAGFLLFARFAGWRWRFPPLAGWMAAGAAAILALGFAPSLATALPAGALLGLALGQAYSASVYYSVHSAEERGARAGIHEAVIGAADFGVPLLGGLVAGGAGWIPAAFLFAAGVAAVSLVAAARAVRGASATSASA